LPFEWGEFITCQDPIAVGKNSASLPRVSDGIYLGVMPRGYYVYLLGTGVVVERTRIWAAPATDDAINFMNDMFIRERSQLKGSEDENGEWIYRGKVVEDNTFDIISPPSELAINAQRIVTDSSVSIAPSPDTLEMPVSLNDPISTIEDFIPNDHVLIGLSEKPVTPDPSPIGLLEESMSPVLSPVNLTKRKTLPAWLLPKDPKKAAKIIVDKRAEAKEKAKIFYDELVLDEKRIVTRNVAKAREQINQRKDLDVSQKRKFKKRVMSQVMSELNDASKSVLVNGLKVSQSIREYGSEVTNAAIIAEIDNFVNNNVFEPVRDSDLFTCRARFDHRM
jgi:hypothetical protein